MKFISWNIDSLNAALTSTSNRAVQTRELLQTIADEAPDAFAIQETKLRASGPTKKHQEALAKFFPDYNYAWRSSEEPARKGYAGTMYLYQKKYEPEVSRPKIGAPAPMDDEGRILTLKMPGFYLVDVYTPNSGDGLKRLDERQAWDDAFRQYLQKLDAELPVLASGDFNCAHEAIDLAHPENNHHSAGFTDEERQHFSKLLDAGFTDSFRYLYPDKEGAYSWWAQRVRSSKANNSGWRIDYWLTSNRLADKIKSSRMLDSGERRDHTAIELDIDL